MAEKTSGLKSGTLGLAGLVALGAVMMSPALGLYGNWGPMAAIVGLPTPLVFLAALLIALPTAASYALLTRRLPSSGSAYAWTWQFISPPAGAWVGLLMAAYYIVAVILQPAFFGLVFNDLLGQFGLAHPNLWTWALGAVVVTVFAMFLTYRGVSVSIKGTVIFLVIEVLVVVALTVTIVATGASHGIGLSLKPFYPSEILGGGGAFWTAMILGVLSFTGFDVISTVAEEAQAPRRLLPRATLLACIVVGVFWAINAWAFSISEPLSAVQDLISSGTTPAPAIAEAYWGAGKILVTLTAMTATAASYVACAVGASRVLFAQGRQGTVPRLLGSTHARSGVPVNALHVVFGIVAIGLTIVTAWLKNPISAYVWWAGSVVFFALITYGFVHASNYAYFRKTKHFNVFLNAVIPTVGITLAVYLLYKSFFVNLWSQDWNAGKSVVVFAVAVSILAALYVLILRIIRPAVLTGPLSEPTNSATPSPVPAVDGQ